MKLYAAVLLGILLIACTAPKQADPREDLAKLQANEWSANYDLTIKAGNMTQTMQVKQFSKGDDYRVDTIVKDSEIRTIGTQGTYITCSKQKEWRCYKADGAEAAIPLKQQIGAFLANATRYNITADGTKEVAGVTAKCFSITTSAPSRYCFSKDGVPLYIWTSIGVAESELIATSYSTVVESNDFVPPVQP